MILNDTPKIHCKDPSVEDHYLFREETGLRIPFTLNGTFSMFETRSLTEDEIENAENYPTIFLTPDSNRWGPYNESYKSNEDSYLDNSVNMIFPTIATENTLVADADLSTSISDFGRNNTGDISSIGSILNTSMVSYRAKNAQIELELGDECEAFKKDAIRSKVASVSCAYDPVLFFDILDDNIALSKFSTAVGSTIASPKYLDSVMDLWYSPRHPYCHYLDSIKKFMDAFSSATHAENPKGVDAKLLQNIWQIDSETAKCPIKKTTQLNRQDVNSKLSRNFGTNDHMLRYWRIKWFFFTDTLFVTKKVASLRRYTFMQIFFSDMGYVYIAAMVSVSEFPKALEMFEK